MAAEIVTRDDKQLKDLVISKIVEMGCACSTDLAGQIGFGTKPNDLRDALNSLVRSGIIRRKIDETDTRQYNEHQVVYELAR